MSVTSTQRRDTWSREQVRALRKKTKNLRNELVIQAKARAWREKKYRDAQKLAMQLTYRNQRLEKLLVQLLEQNQSMRESLEYFANLITAPDWRARAHKSPESYYDGVAHLARRLPNPSLYPVLREEIAAAMTELQPPDTEQAVDRRESNLRNV